MRRFSKGWYQKYQSQRRGWKWSWRHGLTNRAACYWWKQTFLIVEVGLARHHWEHGRKRIPIGRGITKWRPQSGSSSTSEEGNASDSWRSEERKRHCSSIARRWWSKAKIAETKLIVDDDVQRKAEAKTDSEENSGIKNPSGSEGKHVTDEDSLKDSDSSGILICEDFMCFVCRSKRQKTDGMKIDGREIQEHQTGEQDYHWQDGRKKKTWSKKCVITSNVNKSSAQCVFFFAWHGSMSRQCCDVSGDPKLTRWWHGRRVGLDLAERKERKEAITGWILVTLLPNNWSLRQPWISLQPWQNTVLHSIPVKLLWRNIWLFCVLELRLGTPGSDQEKRSVSQFHHQKFTSSIFSVILFRMYTLWCGEVFNKTYRNESSIFPQHVGECPQLESRQNP